MKDKPTETPIETPVAEPIAPVNPITEPIAPVTAPSDQSWPDQTPQPTQIQYVVAQKSLDGIGGMLIFWIIVFSITGAGYLGSFFMTALNPEVNSTGPGIVNIVFGPLIAAAALGTVALIAMRKKLAKLASIITVGILTLGSIITTIVTVATANNLINSYSDYGLSSSTYMQNAQSTLTGAAIGSIVMSLVYAGLVVLYFFTSKRVKQTLIK